MLVVGPSDESTTVHHPKAIDLHDSADARLVDNHARASQFMGNAPVVVGREVTLDVADWLYESSICYLGPVAGLKVVEGATGQVNHRAPV